MKVFTKEDLLALNDGDEGLVEYEHEEAFINSLGSMGSTFLYLGDVTVPPFLEGPIPDEELDLPNYGKCTLSALVDPQTGELFSLIDKRFLVKSENNRLNYADLSDAKYEDGSRIFEESEVSGERVVIQVFENLIDGQWVIDTDFINAYSKSFEEEG